MIKKGSLNLSHFKKIHEDKHSATLQHPEGHQIKIAKSALSKDMKGQLAKLPMHFDEGGEIPNVDQNSSQMPDVNQDPTASIPPDNTDQQQDPSMLDRYKSFMGGLDQKLKDSVGVNQQQPDQPSVTTNNAPSAQVPSNYPIQAQRSPGTQMPPIGLDSMQGMSQGFDQAQKGYQQEAQAQGDLGKSEAAVIDQSQQRDQQIIDDYHKQHQAIDQEIQNTMSDIKNNHIDPSHYMSSKSGFGKAATAIGLILGGISSGLTGQENPAMKFLNAQIDRDVESQKAEMGKKENLLSAFMRQTGNIDSATNMLRGFYKEQQANELAKAASLSKDPMAMARANQAIGQLKIEKAKEIAPLAMKQAVLNGMQNGRVPPAQAVMAIVPKEQQPMAMKELQNNQEVESLRKDMVESFHHIKGQVLNGALSPIDTESAKQAFTGRLEKISEGRYNHDAVVSMINSFFPKTTESENTSANKLQRMNNFLDSLRQEAITGGYGITVPKSVVAKPNHKAGYGAR